MSGVATNGLCWQGAWMCCRCWRVSHERVCHEGLVNGGKGRQVVLYERGTVFVKNDVLKGAHALVSNNKTAPKSLEFTEYN